MEPLSILVAFIFGFGVYRLGLPPLVGYLIAGFALHALGVQVADDHAGVVDSKAVEIGELKGEVRPRRQHLPQS